MKAVSRFFGGLIIGFLLASPTTYASSKFERPSASELAKAFSQAGGKADHDVLNGLTNSTPKEGISETRPVDGANACFPRTVGDQLSKTTQGRTIFPVGMRRIAALSAGDPEFAKQLETQIGFWRANAGDRDAVDPAEMLSLLISPEMGLDQKQVAKALEVYRGILASNTSRTEEHSGNEALQAAGVPKNFIPLLRKINEPDGNKPHGVERLMKLAKVKEVSLSQLLVWMSDPLLPVPSEKVLKDMESAIDKTAAKDLAKAFRKNLQEQAKNVLDEQAVKKALEGWDHNFSQADVETLGAALRKMQKADASEGSEDTGLSTLIDLGKKAGFFELLPKLLGQTAGDACFVNDHKASRLAKLEPLKKELVANFKAKTAPKTATKTETTATKPPADPKQVAETQKAWGETLKGLQDFMAGFGRGIVQSTPAAKKLAEVKREPTSAENTDGKPGQAAPPTNEESGTQFPAALTEGEIKLLSEGVPTLVMWKNGQPNPKLEAIQKAIEKVDPKLGDKASEDEAAAVIAKFLGTLTAEQRNKLAERAKQEIVNAEKLKTENPRLLWLAQRMAWGAGIAAGNKEAAEKNAKFTAAFNAKWNESKKAGQDFYDLLAEMDDPQKRLNAIQKLQTSYDREAAVKWASVHYGSSNPIADTAAKKFMEALTAGPDGKPTHQLAQTVWVNDQPETKIHELGENPEKRWQKIRELASSHDGFAYAPRVTSQAVVQNPPTVNPPVTPPVQKPTQPPATHVSQEKTPERVQAETLLKNACTQCHRQGGDGEGSFTSLTPEEIAARLKKRPDMLTYVRDALGDFNNPEAAEADKVVNILKQFVQSN